MRYHLKDFIIGEIFQRKNMEILFSRSRWPERSSRFLDSESDLRIFLSLKFQLLILILKLSLVFCVYFSSLLF